MFWYIPYISAIKQGRYTHARKAQYTKEIKGIPLTVIKTEPSENTEYSNTGLDNLMQKLLEVQEKHTPGFTKRFQYENFEETQKRIYVSIALMVYETLVLTIFVGSWHG